MEWVFSSLNHCPVNSVLVNNNLKMPAEHLPFSNNSLWWIALQSPNYPQCSNIRALLWQICFVPYMKYKSFWLLSLRFYSRIWFPIVFPSWDEKSVTSWTLQLQSGHRRKLHSSITKRSLAEPCISKSVLNNFTYVRDLSNIQYWTFSGIVAVTSLFLGEDWQGMPEHYSFPEHVPVFWNESTFV